MTEQFFGQCEYCEGWLHGLHIHDTEQFGELELCKDCRELADNGKLEECMCLQQMCNSLNIFIKLVKTS